MRPFTYHAHTFFSDGKSSPEEMIRSAIEAGADTLGFSEHYRSLMFDCYYDMKPAREEEYLTRMLALREEYKDRIEILIGTEADTTSPAPSGFDYVIGSVHHFGIPGEYIEVDRSRAVQLDTASRYFSGDLIALGENYFSELVRLSKMFPFDIVGHFDIFAKFNEDDCLFNSRDPRYRRAGEMAIEALLQRGCRVFEINTGAISRGYRRTPYPDKHFLNILREMGAGVTFGSDSHNASSVVFGFDDALNLASEAGFKSIKRLGKTGFYDMEI